MSTRLEEAIRKLTPEQVRSVEDYAEFLAARKQTSSTPVSRKPKFDWAGMAKDIDPEKSSVEIMEDAIRELAEHADPELRQQARDRSTI
ncbi:MAG TPA: DUF2281 domain-containing protein [Tepidisphaeraceae bacterium]|nr:DUF2281 domain-containing protein [Tepidisphaeraceae bacterium]